MGKPSRPVLLSREYDPKENGYISEEVLAMEGTWIVVYEGQPISLRRIQRHAPGSLKYIKLMYPEAGRATLIAKQLNEEYKTDKFQVVQLDRLFSYISGEDYVPLDDTKHSPRTRLKRGRPKFGAPGTNPKPSILINKRIVVVDELARENIGDFLD